MRSIDEAPQELQDSIREFFPESEWNNAASISYLESGWNAFAEFDSTTDAVGCGEALPPRGGVGITAEHSLSWFQINACNFPKWDSRYFFNTRHNVGTAHMLWVNAGGWFPWYFSAKTLGLI